MLGTVKVGSGFDHAATIARYHTGVICGLQDVLTFDATQVLTFAEDLAPNLFDVCRSGKRRDWFPNLFAKSSRVRAAPTGYLHAKLPSACIVLAFALLCGLLLDGLPLFANLRVPIGFSPPQSFTQTLIFEMLLHFARHQNRSSDDALSECPSKGSV